MNPYLKASGHPLSVAYPNTPGILEAMHANTALQILRAPGQAPAPAVSLRNEKEKKKKTRK